MKIIERFFLLLGIVFGSGHFVGAEEASVSPGVQLFSPQGSVKFVQEVRAAFVTDMVAMGDPRSLKDPFVVQCKSGNEELGATFLSRWADSRNWILNFDKPLGSGVRCLFQARENLKDWKGKAIEGIQEFIFSTGGPAILELDPEYGDIEPDQYFVIQVDGKVQRSQMVEKAFFEVQNIPEPVKIKIIEGQEREWALGAALKNQWRWRDLRKLIEVREGTSPKSRSMKEISSLESFYVLAAQRRFPEGSKVVLHWPSGLVSEAGMALDAAQKFEFEVIPPFRAQFECERVRADRACNPIQDMRLTFSRPLSVKQLKLFKLEGPEKRVWTPAEFSEGPSKNPVKKGPTLEFLKEIHFHGPFPEKSNFIIRAPDKLKDELERPMVNQNKFPLSVATDDFTPLLKFSAPFGILEAKDGVLPVTLRNLEATLPGRKLQISGQRFRLNSLSQATQIIKLYQQTLKKDWDPERRNQSLLGAHQGEGFILPKPNGPRDFEVVGVPLSQKGFYVVEMNSPKLGLELTGKAHSPMYVATSVLVTDLAVHFKKGRESSLVWVTHLSNAEPVAGANILITNQNGQTLAKGKTDAQGKFLGENIEFHCGKPKRKTNQESESWEVSCPIFVFAEKGDDMSFVSSEWMKGIESYRFSVSEEYLNGNWGPIAAHTILDRVVAQPGDVLHMKHIMRERRGQGPGLGFAMMSRNRLPQKVFIYHQGSERTYEIPFTYDPKTGSALSDFTIPKSAPMGRYSIYFSQQKKSNESFDWTSHASGSFLVTEYRLPLIRSLLKIQDGPLIQPSEVKINLSAQQMAGGPAKNMKIRLRATLGERFFNPELPGAQDYRYFSNPVRVGIFDAESEPADETERFLFQKEGELDSGGTLRTEIKNIPNLKSIRNLLVEMEYSDPNGEILTSQTQTSLFPSKSVVGLRTDEWFVAKDKVAVKGVVLDTFGKPRVGQRYVVEAFKSEYQTHRKRLVGGYYSYDSKVETRSLGEVCSGKSDAHGNFECLPKGLEAGELILQASVKDEKGRVTFASVSLNVYEEGKEIWYAPSDSDRIDILPEKVSFEPGENAKFVIRTPFAKATALVTVEREGILESFVTEVQRDHSEIQIPMKDHYAPNIFVSVLLVRGRVGDPQPTAQLDLARPSMKMGLVSTKVGWQGHQLNVQLSSSKKIFQTREIAEIKIKVQPSMLGTESERTSKKAKTPTEVALIAVDESLLHLKENLTWNLLQEMMNQRPLAVKTSSGQNQVIGRRHFGSKAKSPGGGGGMAVGIEPRELFEPVLLWKPKVLLNEQGEALVKVPLNDSLTSFRIVALATAGTGYFGEGQMRIETTRDLIIQSGLPSFVREGDLIKSKITLRNTSQKTMNVKLEAKSPDLGRVPQWTPVVVNPGDSQQVLFEFEVPKGISEINLTLEARDVVTNVSDILKTKLKVELVYSPQVIQATLFQLEKVNSIPLRQPTEAIMGRGGIRITSRESLTAGLGGVNSFMQQYSFTCLEQLFSKAIALENKNEVKRLIEDLPTYQDGNGLLKFFPNMKIGSHQLTHYVLDILQSENYNIPLPTLKKMLTGLEQLLMGPGAEKSSGKSGLGYKGSVKGRKVEEEILILETLSRYGYFKRSLFSLQEINPSLWATETLVAWWRLLNKEMELPGRLEYLKQAENILRSRLNFQGTVMSLQGTSHGQSVWELLSSPDQEVAMVLGLSLDSPLWQKDRGRLVRGFLSRLRQGHWDTTMANAWGSVYLRRFSRENESEKVEGITEFRWDQGIHEQKYLKNQILDRLNLDWPVTAKTTDFILEAKHTGKGKPWVQVEVSAALPLKQPMELGYKMSRKVTPVFQSKPGQWLVGDIANIEVTVEAKSDQSWVVLRDPLPAGAMHLGTGLAGAVSILDQDAPPAAIRSSQDLFQSWPEEYSEKSRAFLTTYAGKLPRGQYRLNYRIRLNTAGEFQLPPTRVEAMYAPENFGEIPNEVWKVKENSY